MIPDLIMLRLGELNLKGRNRSRFENTVLRHIKKSGGALYEAYVYHGVRADLHSFER